MKCFWMTCSGAVGEQTTHNCTVQSYRESPAETWARGIPGSMSSKQVWYFTLPSGARWTRCGRSVLQGRSSLTTVSRTRAHSLTDTVPGMEEKRLWTKVEEYFWRKLHIGRKNAPALLWSYCWKPNMSSERWEKSFSFRALRAEPSAALTLQTDREKHLFIKKASQWPYDVCKADTCRTSVSGWVCVLCGWLGTGKSGAPVLGPLWCRRHGCFPLHSN